MKKLLLMFFLFFVPFFAMAVHVSEVLNEDDPSWRAEIIKMFPNGHPQEVVFYEPIAGGGEAPICKIIFSQNGKIKNKGFVTSIKEEDEGFKIWNSTIVPSGLFFEFDENENLSKSEEYENGILNGFVTTYHKGTDKPKIITPYKNGVINGKVEEFFESGKKKCEIQYENGDCIGEGLFYFEDGSRSKTIPYVGGKAHGLVREWYQSGSIKSEVNFVNGKAHTNEGKSPGAIFYGEDKNIVETADYFEGHPCGLHVKYSDKGSEIFRTFYNKEGKKDGIEQFFSEDHQLIGEGKFVNGKRIGKHWRKENGVIAFEGEFDENGNSISFITEYVNGKKVRQCKEKNEKAEGSYLEWYEDGKLKREYFFVDGLREGKQAEYFPSGKKKAVVFFKNDKSDGDYEEFYESGILCKKCFFKEGVVDGKYEEFYSTGQIKKESFFKDKKENGVQREFWENGKLQTVIEMKDGVVSGKQQRFDQDGNLIFEAFFENGKPNGLCKIWYQKDLLKEKIQFINGKKEGDYKFFHKNGKIAQSSTFKNDLLEGESKSFFEDGLLKEHLFYKNGKPAKECKEFFKDSKPFKLFSYDENGLPHGEHKVFYENGKPQILASFNHGKRDGKKIVWDKDGNIVEEVTYIKDKVEGNYIKRQRNNNDGLQGRGLQGNGVIEMIIPYKNNLKDGAREVFFIPEKEDSKASQLATSSKASVLKSDKILISTIPFKNNLANGMAVEYFIDGNKLSEITYVNGEVDGFAKTYAPNGKLAIVAEVKKNKKNGKVVTYNEEGKYIEFQYVDDKDVGDEKGFFASGKPYYVTPKKDGKIDGRVVYWNENGIVIYEANYVKDVMDGVMRKYNDDGTLILEQSYKNGKLHGVKKKYENGEEVISNYENGKLIEN